MARFVTLKAVNERKLRVLIDTNVLIHAWDERSIELGIKRALVALGMNLRNTHELVMWEFLRGKDQAREVRESRERWLRHQGIKYLSEPPKGSLETLRSLVRQKEARGGPVDALLAAYSIASGGEFVIATRDVDDFCWHPQIWIVEDFLASKACG